MRNATLRSIDARDSGTMGPNVSNDPNPRRRRAARTGFTETPKNLKLSVAWSRSGSATPSGRSSQKRKGLLAAALSAENIQPATSESAKFMKNCWTFVRSWMSVERCNGLWKVLTSKTSVCRRVMMDIVLFGLIRRSPRSERSFTRPSGVSGAKGISPVSTRLTWMPKEKNLTPINQSINQLTAWPISFQSTQFKSQSINQALGHTIISKIEIISWRKWT